MVNNCAMVNCKSNGNDKNIIFHSFPKENKLKRKWVHSCKRADAFKMKHPRVCSLHFLNTDYERDLMSELLGLPPKKKLKSDAVPSVNLPDKRDSENNAERALRQDLQAQKRELNSGDGSNIEHPSELVDIQQVCVQCKRKENLIEKLNNENECLKEQISALKLTVKEKNCLIASFRKDQIFFQRRTLIKDLNLEINNDSKLCESNIVMCEIKDEPSESVRRCSVPLEMQNLETSDLNNETWHYNDSELDIQANKSSWNEPENEIKNEAFERDPLLICDASLELPFEEQNKNTLNDIHIKSDEYKNDELDIQTNEFPLHEPKIEIEEGAIESVSSSTYDNSTSSSSSHSLESHLISHRKDGNQVHCLSPEESYINSHDGAEEKVGIILHSILSAQHLEQASDSVPESDDIEVRNSEDPHQIPEQNHGVSFSPSVMKLHSQSKKLRKKFRQTGKEYVSSKGKLVPAKTFKETICNCRLECKKKVTEEERKQIFEHFWGLGLWEKQTSFIVESVKEFPVKRRTTCTPNNRNINRKYFLNGKTVCKTAFLNTLSISNKRMHYATRLKTKTGDIFIDKRGGNPPNKTPTASLEKIDRFLNNFPKFTSQYCMKRYFRPELSIQKLYHMYLNELKENNDEHLKVSYKTFLKQFKVYNVPIYNPKKESYMPWDGIPIQMQVSQPN